MPRRCYQAGLVRRKSVPLDLLNELYLKAESGLRQEIMTKFGQLDPAEVDKAFERSRIRPAPAATGNCRRISKTGASGWRSWKPSGSWCR